MPSTLPRQPPMLCTTCQRHLNDDSVHISAWRHGRLAYYCTSHDPRQTPEQEHA